MPIQVICTNCHARFQVSDKFAGKTGPCPKCKGQIRVPEKSEEVVIHAPENFGPKDAQGRAVLKPIEREETEVTPLGVGAILGTIIGILAVAVLLRLVGLDGAARTAVLALGSYLVALPVVYAGYTFLREDEIEPYRGRPLLLRVAICSLVYAALWGGYAYMSQLWGSGSPELFYLVFILPVLIGIGAVGSLATLDLQFGNAALHCCFYLLVTVLLRVVMGLPAY